RTILWLTTLVSAAWIVGGMVIGHGMYGADLWRPATLAEILTEPQGLMLALGILLPVVLFWSFAVMVRRAQEMRLAAQSMTEIAFRLAEPENLAADRLITVGQAVRREVHAMGEGIERTLARAVELESLVHSEVNLLERAYSENESRIRGLVNELGNERDMVVSHAERLRASIAGAHDQLKEELNAASAIIRENVINASTQLTSTLSASGMELIRNFNDSGNAIYN